MSLGGMKASLKIPEGAKAMLIPLAIVHPIK